MNKEIIYIKEKGIEFIQFKRLLDYGIKHAYTLKKEDIDFSSDSPKMEVSYEKLCKVLDLDTKNLVKPKQTHTSNVRCIDKIEKREDLEDIDGIITDKKNIILSTKNADCILFLLYDPVKNVIGNIHSGWRGTFKKIVEKAVLKMITNYNSDPKDIVCCICPSIRKCHFEVDEDVKELCEEIFSFTNKTKDFIFVGDIKQGKQKYYIDTIEINKILLKQLGLKDENIIDCEICSVCNSEKISSNRVEGKKFTRATAIISL